MNYRRLFSLVKKMAITTTETGTEDIYNMRKFMFETLELGLDVKKGKKSMRKFSLKDCL